MSESTPIRVLHLIASVDRKSGGPIEGIIQQAANRNVAECLTHIASLDVSGSKAVTSCPVPVIALGSRSFADEPWRRYLPWVRYRFQPKAISLFKNIINDYDIVVVNGIWNYSSLVARVCLINSGVPYVVFTHGMLDPWFKKAYPFKSMLKQFFWLFNEGPLLNNASAVLFTTEDEKEVSRNAFWPYKVKERVVGYGTSDIPAPDGDQDVAFRSAVPSLRDRRYLLYLSRIHPKKGCDLLISAFAQIAPGHPDLDLVIAGPDEVGWKASLETQAAALGVAGRIHWPGMLTGDAKWGAYRGCDAFVLPSHQENFGIVVAEALAAGKPVLISDKVQIWREVVGDGGGLVEPDDAEGTTRLLQRYLALDAAPIEAMRAAARGTFVERFLMQKVVRTINDAFRDAIYAKP